MAKVPSYLKRATAILKMPEAIARGLTQSAFFRELKATTGTYRNQRMIQDWHNVAGTEAKKDTYKYIRKDRLPTQQFVVDVDWEMSKNYMYKFEVSTSRIEKDGLKPIYVNIMKDTLLPITQIQAEVYERQGVSDSIPKEPITNMRLIGIWHKVPSLEMPTPTPFMVE